MHISVYNVPAASLEKELCAESNYYLFDEDALSE